MDQDPGGDETGISVTLLDSDVVWLTWGAGLHIDESVAREAMKAVDELNGDRNRPLFVDAAGPTAMTRGARQVFTERCSVSRIALLGRSAVDRMVCNFVLRLTTPPVPTRMFTSESAAMQWLGDDRSPG